jgi:aspartate 1-decarboxylase
MHAVAEATIYRIVGGARAQALGATGAAALKQRGSELLVVTSVGLSDDQQPSGVWPAVIVVAAAR